MSANPTQPTQPTQPTERIVIVSGNEYRVPVTTSEPDLRSHLASMFPDITHATLNREKRTVEGVEYETWEFVKRAGTKGSSSAELAALLTHVPPVRVSALSRRTARAVHRLLLGDMTVEDAVNADLIPVVSALPGVTATMHGGMICAQLDTLPANADLIPVVSALPGVTATMHGGMICAQLDTLPAIPAVPGGDPIGW